MQFLSLTSLSCTSHRPTLLSTVYLGTHLVLRTTSILHTRARRVARSMIHTLQPISKLVKGWRAEATAAI
ncbi:hypothetical protein T440DRAFT_401766 [Plenodomus tracheiphilus IPT5]|uniref:Uncharacterized protein n=1 Tax=Plenodomus tracheiphilus IPT5 TaxID=1408161 RepID=A0A6A7AY78_9PLEO|nr:hypothetical protein T440DRAFT_401766 [Plenodomus tracheiphilus IPT5]